MQLGGALMPEFRVLMCAAFVITEIIPHIEVIHTHTQLLALLFIFRYLKFIFFFILKFGVRARDTTVDCYTITLSLSFLKKSSGIES